MLVVTWFTIRGRPSCLVPFCPFAFTASNISNLETLPLLSASKRSNIRALSENSSRGSLWFVVVQCISGGHGNSLAVSLLVSSTSWFCGCLQPTEMGWFWCKSRIVGTSFAKNAAKSVYLIRCLGSERSSQPSVLEVGIGLFCLAEEKSKKIL